MIDIDAEFRKIMYGSTTANKPSESDKTLTLDMLRDAARNIGLPIPQVKLSKHVPALGSVHPKSMPSTDDMRKMVSDIGEQLGPVAWVLKTDDRDVVFINPVNAKDQSNE